MTSWREVKLGDVCDIFTGKKDVNQTVENGEYMFFSCSPKEFRSNDYLYNGEAIIIAGNGSYTGRVRFFSGKFDLYQRTYACVLKTSVNDVYMPFVYYVMKGKFEPRYLGGTRGSSIPYIVMGDLTEFPIYLPPMDIQRKIAGVLSALDDKIELNNKINNNLEQQAQALFKSWFVDFEPFGGVMPEDWKEQDIYSIANIIYGAPFASKLFNTEKRGKPIIRIRDLKNQYSDTYTEEVHPKAYIIRAGDIVVGMDGEFRPYIWGNDEGLLNQRVCVFENKRPMGKMFLYLTIKPLLNRVEQTEVATTVIHIGKQDFDAFKFNMPVSDILDKFDKITNPIYDKIVSNSLENTRLAAIRDALLPKLMSGEIDVSNVDIPALTSADKLSFSGE